MSSTFGNSIKISIFGQSHSEGIGVVVDGLPPGKTIDFSRLQNFMERRAPGGRAYSTTRSEKDLPKVFSGIFEGKTCGAPLSAVIENTNTRTKDYANLTKVPRPGHGDYTGWLKYKGFGDYRGGGHFSGRLTAPLCFAGGVCAQYLEDMGITISAHILSIADERECSFSDMNVDEMNSFVTAATGGCTKEERCSCCKEETAAANLGKKDFAVIDDAAGERMQKVIAEAKKSGDSVGGIVECMICGVPAGAGNPMFEGVENILATLLFGIPAVKGVEFGIGFAATQMRGSQCNDDFFPAYANTNSGIDEIGNCGSDIADNTFSQIHTDANFGNGKTKSSGNDAANVLANLTTNAATNVSANMKLLTKTDNHGGILGGITSGMPIIFRVAFKPTASIAMMQQSVNLETGNQEELQVVGRHDPCIVPRAVPVVEAVAAIGIMEILKTDNLLPLK